MEIRQFAHKKGLKKTKQWRSKPFFCADYCEIELTVSSDQDLEIICLWTLDGKNCPETSKVMVSRGPRMHMESLRVNNPYISIQIKNLGHPSTNNSLYVRAVGIKPDTTLLNSPLSPSPPPKPTSPPPVRPNSGNYQRKGGAKVFHLLTPNQSKHPEF
jgi:hypothetical protein